MKLRLYRKYRKENYTIGQLYVDGAFFCNTLEDKDRGLDSSMSYATLRRMKVPDETAIPYGTYNITLDVISPKFSKYKFYKDTCDGFLPRLISVPAFDGILIHAGNTHKDTSGCILVGLNKVKGQVVESKEVFKELYKRMKSAKIGGQKITIEIFK